MPNQKQQFDLGHCSSLSCVNFHTRTIRSYLKQKEVVPVFCTWCGIEVPVPDGKPIARRQISTEKLDGLGNKLIADALYYVQDARSVVGNCGSWWRPNGDGYCCDINEAGKYCGEECRDMRDSDVPWPVNYVRERIVNHVRVDNQAFRRRDRA